MVTNGLLMNIIIIGCGVSYQTLREAGIDRADLLIAVTDSDQRLLLWEGLQSADGFAALTGPDEENILLPSCWKKY